MAAHRLALGLVVLAATIGGSGEIGAAPETFDTALPVGRRDFVSRGQFVAAGASHDRSPADREIDFLGGIGVLGYGVTSKLALFGVLPYLDKELKLTTPGGHRIRRAANGIGDAQLFARDTVFQRDQPDWTFRIATFLGLEIPTGDDDDGDRFGRLPATLQLGSGSWDPFGGLIATYQTLDYEVDTQICYAANTEANDFEFGDELRLDTSLQYRLWPRALTAGVPGFLDGVVEANLLHQEKNEISGSVDPDSGGTTLFLSPGLQYVTKRWVLEAIVRAGFRVNY